MRKLFNRLEDWFLSMPQERRALAAFLISFFNVYCLFRIDLRTLLPWFLLLVLIITTILTGYSLAGKYWNQKNKNYRHFVAWVVLPAVLHVFFLLNYHVSFNEQKETYGCYPGIQYEPRGRGGQWTERTNTMIYLDEGRYNECPGIRLFFDRTQIKGNQVTYTFARGIFGLRVMKDWEFTYTNGQ
jgi:hypothetical protein